MSNMYEGIGADDVPTAPYHVPGSAPRGSGAGGPAPRGRGGGWSRGKKAAALLGVCAVVGGGAFAVTSAVTGTSATAQTASTQSGTIQAGTSASATGQVAALRDVLASSGIRRLARLRLLGGMYGQYTFQTASGPRTLAFERGTIASVSGGDVLIRAADGVTWTWALTGTSVVRENGTKEAQGANAAQSALRQGQTVFAGGPVVSGTRDARVIVIRKAGTTTGTTAGTTPGTA